MDEFLGGLTQGGWQAVVEALQANWVPVVGFVAGTLFFSRLCSTGGVLQRLVGLVGLAFLAWCLWRYAWGGSGGGDDLGFYP